jgi:hypothetical protein
MASIRRGASIGAVLGAAAASRSARLDSDDDMPRRPSAERTASIRRGATVGAVLGAAAASRSARLNSGEMELPANFSVRTPIVDDEVVYSDGEEVPIIPPQIRTLARTLARSGALSRSSAAMGNLTARSSSARLSSPRRSASSLRSTLVERAKNIDARLKEMGISVLFSLFMAEHTADDDVPVVTIIGMTPLGTVIGIKLEDKNHFNLNGSRLKITKANSLLSMEQSWLSSLGQQSQGSSIVMCKDGGCMMTKNEFGKLITSYFNIESSPSDEKIASPDSPTPYPLVNIKEIMANFRAQGEDNPPTPERYIEFLNNLAAQAENITRSETENRLATLKTNIEFLREVVANIDENRRRIQTFYNANNSETAIVAARSRMLLQLRLSNGSFTEEMDAEWKQLQERLSLLSYNNIALLNGLKTYNDFSKHSEHIDRSTFHIFFSLYSRILHSMNDPTHANIRSPNNWISSESGLTLFPLSTAALTPGQPNPSIPELLALIDKDLAMIDINSLDETTRVQLTHFKSVFYA